MFQKIFDWYERHERHVSTLALAGGFIFDNLTLQRIDLLFENLLQIFYLVISGSGIILINYFLENPPKSKFFDRLNHFLPLFIQFTFGGLFSAFFIFYSRSASLSSSWPFLFVLLFILIGNEFFKKRYQRMTFQVSIYFVAIFSFFIFFVPVMLKDMGPSIFILSGIASLLFISIFSYSLSKLTKGLFSKSRQNIVIIVSFLYLLINILYFLNLIPPIPLSLKEVGIYHNVERVGENYILRGEEKLWHSFFKKEVYHQGDGETAFVFSSVFAPTDLNIRILHDWQYFDEEKNEWVSSGRISFPIRGGRGGGYRGFSQKTIIWPALWRVDIKTERGQVIGRINFEVRVTKEEVPLQTTTL